ncbi:MAG TPA: glycine--tRNA ligase subunit beta, partial [Sphingomonadales bacterium]
MAELLLELFSEEIPARMQAQAAEDLKRLFIERLKSAGLAFDNAQSFATPRRLALVVDGLPVAQPDVREERKGPRADAPAQAIEGFLRSTGLTRDQLEERQTDKGAVLFAVIERKGSAVAEVIAEIVPEIVRSFPWPKSQRWGAGSLRWVRPLKSILCLFDGKVVPFAVDGIASTDTTRGHRFLSPEPFAVTGFADYRAKLRDARVILDAAERREMIAADAARLAAEAGLELIEDKGLLAEVAGLVEWPVALIGAFDPAFLEVPAEVLTATMRANQKYFSLRDAATGKLA